MLSMIWIHVSVCLILLLILLRRRRDVRLRLHSAQGIVTHCFLNESLYIGVCPLNTYRVEKNHSLVHYLQVISYLSEITWKLFVYEILHLFCPSYFNNEALIRALLMLSSNYKITKWSANENKYLTWVEKISIE